MSQYVSNLEIKAEKDQSDHEVVYKPGQAQDWARERLGELGTGPSFVFSLLRESESCVMKAFCCSSISSDDKNGEGVRPLLNQLICQCLKEKRIWVPLNIKILWRGFWTSSLVAKVLWRGCHFLSESQINQCQLWYLFVTSSSYGLQIFCFFGFSNSWKIS